MANKWQSGLATSTLGKPLRKFIQLVEQTNKLENQVLGGVRDALTVAQTFVTTISVDPLEEAIRALVDQVNTLLDQLTQDTACHAIIVPIQKNYSGSLLDIGNVLTNVSYSPNFDDLVEEGSYAERVVPSIAPETIDFINTSPSAQGGNRGFWSALWGSTKDRGDPNRPRFTQDFAVSGVVLIFGSGKLSTINQISAALYALFRFGIFSDNTGNTQPVAQNFRAMAVPVLERSGAANQNRIGVQLDWDPIPPVRINSLYDPSASIVVDEILIVRSTDAGAREVFNWHSIFPNEPSDTLTDLPKSGTMKVIARMRNDGFIRRYVDSSPDLKEDTVYYYGIALRSYSQDKKSAANPSPPKIRQPVSGFSAMRRVYYTRRVNTTRGSTPPDWFATPSLVQLFPIVEDILGTARLWVANLLSRSVTNNGITNILQQLIDQTTRLLAQLQAVVDKMKQLSELLNVLRDANLAAISSTSFHVKSGGMDGWLAELARRLSDPNDPSRPPFDANELVSGVVIVAGAPNFSQLSAFNALRDIFFGGDKDDGPVQLITEVLGETPPLPSAAIRDAADDNNTLSPAASPFEIRFDDALVATRFPVSTPTSTQDAFFDDDMAPIPAPNC